MKKIVNTEITLLKNEVEHLENQIKALKESSSWKVTAPIRKFKSLFIKKKKRNHQKNITEITLPDYENIYFDKYETPEVSIIIPIYGQIGYTLKCLESIQQNLPKTSFEIIVVNDCSPDNSKAILKKIKGIQLINNENNLGFILSCNKGANIANGKYIYLLNNDTRVTNGWLDELVQTFRNLPGTGLVGSKLIYPDGRLQEAGGIIWDDASGWNFGKLDDPGSPIYNYAREVDYCSGASIMIPKQLYLDLKGFDEQFIPAYYEDADLAFRIREKGYRVIYQPASVVEHYEGITSGTDLGSGVKAHQVSNRKKFANVWKDSLNYYPKSDSNIDKAKDKFTKKRVFVIDEIVPTPNEDAGSLLTFNMLILLREMGFQPTFMANSSNLYIKNHTLELQKFGIEVLYSPYVDTIHEHLVEYGSRYDLVIVFRPFTFQANFSSIKTYCPSAKILYHSVDLHYLRMQREALINHNMITDTQQIEIDKIKKAEMLAISAADASIVVSTVEKEILDKELPQANVKVLPLIMSVPGARSKFSDRSDIVFVGGFQHLPNVDAVIYFTNEIMPLLHKINPLIKFHIVGSKVPEKITSLASDNIIVHGFIEDLESFLDNMKVSVAPLRYGAGIKGKVATAMANGLPVVASKIAVEGMGLTNHENILVAENPEEYVQLILDIYNNSDLWEKISRNGVQYADNAWGASSYLNELDKIFKDLNISEVTKNTKYPIQLYN